MTQPSPKKTNEQMDAEALKAALIEVLQERNAYHPDKVNWKDEETMEVSGLSHFAMHALVLKAEELGKKITFEKQTIIKIA